MTRTLLIATLTLPIVAWSAPSGAHELAKLERSLWINVSLATPKRGYWGLSFPEAVKPSETQIANAVGVLIRDANPNRLYLVHHHELPFGRTAEMFRAWRKSCPPSVELVPALVLRMYDKGNTPVFTEPELSELLTFLKAEINPARIAVYDVLPNREQGAGLSALAKVFPKGLVRVGLQPDEPLEAPFSAAVEDTWSGFCHGLTNDDWQERGFGRDTLRKWVASRNAQQFRIAYDLIVVGWDYANTKRGEYPGYDDAHKNLPLPAERNRLAVAEILAQAEPGRLAGFSSDLLIVELNSETPPHDGKASSFYETLKAGRGYEGFYATPWQEVCRIFKSLGNGDEPMNRPHKPRPVITP
ncbi:MAG: hypothetical protein HZA92_00200 [Verrucomicrobia bacterium]|nr:hypothetical protein [Verrucomicrobiota bacterium]